VISTDFYATLLDAARLPLQEEQAHRAQDGLSLVPLLRGAESLERRSLMFHYPNYAFHRSNRLGGAIREGRWKLIENFADDSLELYDLSQDLSERQNLADSQSDLAQAMQQRLAAWRRASGAAMPRPVSQTGG
jgi:arylsulfatase A-like enzyme